VTWALAKATIVPDTVRLFVNFILYAYGSRDSQWRFNKLARSMEALCRCYKREHAALFKNDGYTRHHLQKAKCSSLSSAFVVHR